MRALVRQGLAEGAVGLSAGLTYAPGMYASDDELVALCSELTDGAFYCPHHRNYGLHAIKGYARLDRDRAPLRASRCTSRTPTSASPATAGARASCSR